MAVVCVRTMGPGLDEKEIPHLFERFYKGNKGNFGIGLSITRAAMEYMGGRVQRPQQASALSWSRVPADAACGGSGWQERVAGAYADQRQAAAGAYLQTRGSMTDTVNTSLLWLIFMSPLYL